VTTSKNNETTRARAIVPWIGGKSILADRIIPLFTPHHCYVEVFAGAGSILFRKPESRVEILNDINLELVTLYRVIKHHLDEFIRYLRWLLTAREEFERFKATDPATLTDVQRAVRFYYLHRNAFAPGLSSPVFRCDTTHKSRFNLLRIEEDLSAVHLRLAGVFVENLPYARAIERFDKASTFFYIDPPYHGCEKYYGKGIFAREDFAALAELLGRIRGRFCMSINDVAEIRRLFGRFHIRSIATKYRVGRASQKPVRELLIMNYRPGAER
jgi:DNA adenine methylase